MSNFDDELSYEEEPLMNSYEEEALIKVKQLEKDFNDIKENKNSIDTNLEFIEDLEHCHNKESALTLEELNINDKIISIPINNFKYCYTLSELKDLIDDAIRKQGRNIYNIRVRDLYTNTNIPNDILVDVYKYLYPPISFKKGLKQIFIEAFEIFKIDELEQFIINMIQYDRNLVIDAKYNFYRGYKSVLQYACNKGFGLVALYILNNFTPDECMLNYVNHLDLDDGPALMYALFSIPYQKNTDIMFKVAMRILEFSPDENNLYYIIPDSNYTSFIIACSKDLTDIALKILENKPSIDFIETRTSVTSANQEALMDEYSYENKSALDFVLRNDMDKVKDKLIELYGPSMKQEKRQKTDMYGYIDDLYNYDSRLLEFQPRGHFGGKLKFKRKSKRKSNKKSKKHK